MKTITLNRDSWHYWVAKQFGWSYWNEKEGDFCAYVRRVMLGCFLLGAIGLLILVLTTFVAIPSCIFIYWLFICLVNLSCPAMTDAQFAGAIFLSLALAVLLSLCLIKGWIKLPKIHVSIPSCAQIPYCEDTKKFIVAAWISTRDKICFKLDFKD